MRRDFLKNYHQQTAKLNDSDPNIEFILGEIDNFQQIGNAHLEYGLKIEKDVAVVANRALVDGDVISLVNIAFTYCFTEARLSTGGSDIEDNEYVGQVSTIMRGLTSKDGDLLTHFDKMDETEAEINNTSLHHHLVNNHYVAANEEKTKGQLPLEHSFAFLETF